MQKIQTGKAWSTRGTLLLWSYLLDGRDYARSLLLLLLLQLVQSHRTLVLVQQLLLMMKLLLVLLTRDLSRASRSHASQRQARCHVGGFHLLFHAEKFLVGGCQAPHLHRMVLRLGRDR